MQLKATATTLSWRIVSLRTSNYYWASRLIRRSQLSSLLLQTQSARRATKRWHRRKTPAKIKKLLTMWPQTLISSQIDNGASRDLAQTKSKNSDWRSRSKPIKPCLLLQPRIWQIHLLSLLPKLMKPRPLLNWVARSTKESLTRLVSRQWRQILHRKQAVLRSRPNLMSDSLAWSEQRLRRCACLHLGNIQRHHNYWSRSRQYFQRRRLVASILNLAHVRTILSRVRGKWRRDQVEILFRSNRKTSYYWARRLCPLQQTTLSKTRARKLVGSQCKSIVLWLRSITLVKTKASLLLRSRRMMRSQLASK